MGVGLESRESCCCIFRTLVFFVAVLQPAFDLCMVRSVRYT